MKMAFGMYDFYKGLEKINSSFVFPNEKILNNSAIEIEHVPLVVQCVQKTINIVLR